MNHKDNAVDFYNIYNNQATVDEAVSALKKYLADSKMRSIGSWGTERELEVAAVMFQVDIFVFCQYGRDRAWAPHLLETMVCLDLMLNCIFTIAMDIMI